MSIRTKISALAKRVGRAQAAESARPFAFRSLEEQRRIAEGHPPPATEPGVVIVRLESPATEEEWRAMEAGQLAALERQGMLTNDALTEAQ